MKEEVLQRLNLWKKRLVALRKALNDSVQDRVGKLVLRNEADEIATEWVEHLRGPLEYQFALSDELVKATSVTMQRLQTLSRPNNLKTSYLEVINEVLKNFDNKFVLPVKQTAITVQSVIDLHKLVPMLRDAEESKYLREAIDCAGSGYRRASIVMGWCAAIDKIQKKIQVLGFGKFNTASARLKAQPSGRFKRWNKEFSVSTLSELQEVFDTDLITVSEGLGLLDSNQGDRLKEVCFQYRNHSAHPGNAPIEDAHLVAFFTDVTSIVLNNPVFQ